MNTKRKPNATDTFYATQTPSNAVALAIGDHEASNPSGGSREFVFQLHRAKDRLDAYPKLVAALQVVNEFLAQGTPVDPGALFGDTDETVGDAIAELLRKAPTVES